MLKLSGLIDPHVHLRTPGQTQKEDFFTGTSAALAGGFTTVIDMPNNAVPVTTNELLEMKMETAKKQTVCDIGFYFGSLGDNLEEFEKVKDKVFGLKLYLNVTTGNYIIDEKVFEKICIAWHSVKRMTPPLSKGAGAIPILVHAEEDILESILIIANKYDQKIHVCHVSSEKELAIVLNAKQKGWKVTCGVTPHHLLLSADTPGESWLPFRSSLLPRGWMNSVKPTLKHKSEVNFLWEHLKDIDVIESDHAPHTIEDKHNGDFGFPGLETTLPLLLTAMHQGKLSIEEITRLCHDNPAKIFGISNDPHTFIEIDEDQEWTIKNKDLKTKCHWSPFNGWKVKGKVKRVFIRGTKVFENDTILAKPGSGSILRA